MTDNKTKNEEVIAFLDTLPNLVRTGETKIVENFLRSKFEESLPSKIARYGNLPYLITQLGLFSEYLLEARNLYVEEYYRGAVALCGMTVEALCTAIAIDRVNDDESLKNRLIDPSEDCRKKIEYLKKYFRIAKSASLLHRVLDIRRDYLHLHRTTVLAEEVLECINRLHLAVIAEYGLIPAGQGKAQAATEEYINQLAREMKLT